MTGDDTRTLSPALADAVEQAYRVFAGARIGRRLHVCRCNVCFGDDIETEQALVRTPLREIPAALLAEYTNSAHGWHDEMRYFLPRYFELIAAGDPPAHFGDFDYALARLASTDRPVWPEAERHAVDGFFVALIVECLRCWKAETAWWVPDGPPDPFYWDTPLVDLLCMVSNARGEIAPLLRLVDETHGLVPDLHVAALANEAGQTLCRGKLGWHTLAEKDDAEARIVAWLMWPELAARLEEGFFAARSPIDGNTLSLAVSVLDAARAASA